MREIILFHHAQGLTDGVAAFADRLRAAGHTVHTPDLFEGRTFDTVEAGVAHAQEIGFDTVAARGVAAAERLPAEVVYAGMSLGVIPAEQLVVTRPGARGALFLHSAMPTSEFGGPWPVGVGLQIHAMTEDPWFDEDRPYAEQLVAEAGGELFSYPGRGHLFTDSSLAEYDAGATDLVLERAAALLG
ncbi:dienelactone hydrolase [Nocardioides mangrovicus]|uniref:Dienelactone hydrolase n=1 Tax=Nocardioides mangrovicus TaxID=2478913 RepID=A0A3L8P1Q5_9ACTN|nr:dienelactone hydrolase family protein [Nocardioides mangrovicus]RLV49245.1 dienelactone hydrolase [Nocardioides mangrovicus]